VLRNGWSLDISDWRYLAEMLARKRWDKVPFDKSAQVQVPSLPGVYLIVAQSPCLTIPPCNSFSTPLYAGKSGTSVKNRFTHHIKSPEVRVKLIHELMPSANIWFYFTLTDKSKVSALESILIECYGPSANVIKGSARLRDPIAAG